MFNKTLPQINERMFFMDKEIIVIKVFEIFQLAEIRFLYSSKRFAVDINALSREPDMTSSISIKTLGGIKL
jgi:hypothetical protein